MENKLNILQKIQTVRVDLQNKDIKKSGYNKYSNYKYFELGDFLPHINDLCKQYGLYTEFLYGNDKATLSVYNTENIEEVRIWTTPVEVATLKGCSTIQNIGGTQSFARRYLYMMAFEIAEADILDNGESVDTDAEEGKKKIGKAHIFTINKLISETDTDLKMFLKWANVSRVEDITNDMVGSCINELSKKKEKLEQSRKELMKQKENQLKADEIDF